MFILGKPIEDVRKIIFYKFFIWFSDIAFRHKAYSILTTQVLQILDKIF